MVESDLYPEVMSWFSVALKGRYKNANISVFDTSRIELRNFLYQNDFHKSFPQWQSYAIKNDITALIKFKNKIKLGFVECKVKSISLKDISQLLGYSKVAKPLISIILSPGGISDPVNQVINIHNRLDILEYDENKNLIICKWDTQKKCIDRFNIYPAGSFS